jgi:hypothetical protein
LIDGALAASATVVDMLERHAEPFATASDQWLEAVGRQ